MERVAPSARSWNDPVLPHYIPHADILPGDVERDSSRCSRRDLNLAEATELSHGRIEAGIGREFHIQLCDLLGFDGASVGDCDTRGVHHIPESGVTTLGTSCCGSGLRGGGVAGGVWVGSGCDGCGRVEVRVHVLANP